MALLGGSLYQDESSRVHSRNVPSMIAMSFDLSRWCLVL